MLHRWLPCRGRTPGLSTWWLITSRTTVADSTARTFPNGLFEFSASFLLCSYFVTGLLLTKLLEGWSYLVSTVGLYSVEQERQTQGTETEIKGEKGATEVKKCKVRVRILCPGLGGQVARTRSWLSGNSAARGNPGEDKAIGGEHWQSWGSPSMLCRRQDSGLGHPRTNPQS